MERRDGNGRCAWHELFCFGSHGWKEDIPLAGSLRLTLLLPLIIFSGAHDLAYLTLFGRFGSLALLASS